MTDEMLKACPFCGGEAEHCSNLEWSQGGPMHWVLCKDCHACPGDRKTKAEAITAWNTRTLSSSPVEGRE
jgi:Lar family restriction alleviation protein